MDEIISVDGGVGDVSVQPFNPIITWTIVAWLMIGFIFLVALIVKWLV